MIEIYPRPADTENFEWLYVEECVPTAKAKLTDIDWFANGVNIATIGYSGWVERLEKPFD